MAERAEVLAKYVRKGALRQIPAKLAPRLEILSWLAEQFEPGRSYPETEVNALLGGHEIDHATLRRLLVDYGFLGREHSIYRRAPQAPQLPGAD